MYGSQYIFSKGFFVAWIVVAIIWMWITMLIAGFYPIIDGFGQIRAFFSKSDAIVSESTPAETSFTGVEKVVEPKTTELSSSSGQVSLNDGDNKV